MTKQASLPMYDFPEIRHALDAWWLGIAQHMRKAGVADVPPQLQPVSPVKQLWDHNQLFLSQCCGFDVVFGYKGALTPLMITDWQAEGCLEGQYSSWVVVSENSPYQSIEDLQGTTAAINSNESHSGMHALMTLVQPHSQQGRFFKRILASGAHASSLAMVQSGEADVAAIDCITFALLKTHRPSAIEGIRVLRQTAHAPAHPYVVRSSTPIDTQHRMQAGLHNAFNDPSLDTARHVICLKQGLFDRQNDYQRIVDEFQYDTALLAALDG